MKKKYAIFTVIIFILLVTIFTYFSTLKQNNIYKEESIKSTKITKGISMMLEQNSGAGDYKLVTQSGWPTDGYILNTELSRCENGSTLNWDDTKKVVIVSGNLSDKCYVYFDKVFTLASYVISQYTGTQGANNIYYHNSSLSNGAGDNSYRYAGGDYVLTEKATTVGMKSLTSSSNTATDGITNFYCDGERLYLHDYNLYEYCDTNSSTYYFTLQYDTSNTQYQTYNEALEKAVSDGYLTKDNVKNFVCFGSNISPCPVENLYRVIGVIDNKVKLIKYDYATSALLGEDGAFNETYTLADTGTEPMYRGSLTTLDHYYWNNDTGTNTWSESDLNKINLAYILEDGQKIYIPNKSEKIENNEYIIDGSGNNAKSNSLKEVGKVNINEAMQTELEQLPGIGPSLATRIIEYREQNGNFNNVEDLQNVKGIGDAKFNDIKDKVTV